MASQRCPNCGKSQDTRIYISGTKIPCASCGLTMEVVREDVSQLKAAVNAGVPAAAPAAAEALAPPVETPSADMEAASKQSTIGGPLRPTVVANPPEGDSASTVVRATVKLPGYELIHVLGRGGMGEVWSAKQLSLNREVAVKLLSPDLAKDGAFIKRFEKEAAALAALGHPNIVQIIDRGQSEGIYFFAMEFVAGCSLRDRMDERRLSTSESLRYIAQITRAIAYAHERGVVHRDLKPENILIGADDQLKVADFGLAGMRDERFNVTHTSMTMGTLNYMAPEQRKDAKSVDGRADIYSLGVMLYELLTGDVPVGRFKLPSELVPHLNPRLDGIVATSLESDPAARHQKAADFLHAIEEFQSTISLPSSTVAEAEVPTPEHPSKIGTPLPLRTDSEVSHVAKGVGAVGRVARAGILGLLLFFGLGVVTQAFFHVELFSLDQHGLTIGLKKEKPVEAPVIVPPAKVPPAFPADTRRDVEVHSTTIGDPHSPITVIQSDLAPGTDSSFVAMDGEWSNGPQGLTARVFSRFQKDGARPRATLEEPSFHLEDLSTEVKVTIDDQPLAGYVAAHPPMAFVNFHAKDVVLQLTMELGPTPTFRGSWKSKDEGGESKTTDFIDPELDDLRPPPARTEVGLKLVVKRGFLTVFANDKPILSKAVKLPDRFASSVGRVGVGCEEAVCTFRDFRVEGQAEHNRDLGDDVHVHSVVAK